MNEDEVKQKVQEWLEKQGYIVKPEIGVSGTEREIILDFFAYKDPPSILWIEAKGDESLSQLLEGFIRVELAIFLGGGQGILAVPTEACQKLLKYKDFLNQAKNVIKLFDAQQGQTYQL